MATKVRKPFSVEPFFAIENPIFLLIFLKQKYKNCKKIMKKYSSRKKIQNGGQKQKWHQFIFLENSNETTPSGLYRNNSLMQNSLKIKWCSQKI
jgi:hypothetical protein